MEPVPTQDRAGEAGRERTYTATDKGRDLVPVLVEIMRWSHKHLPGTTPPPEDFPHHAQ